MFDYMAEEDYTIYKQQQYILFSIVIGEYNEDFFLISVLENLKIVLEFFINEKAIIDTSKEHIYNFLIDARNINDRYRVRRINLINDMISILNFCKEDKYLEFYREELSKRKKNFKYFLYDSDILKKEINITNYCICCDYLILHSHSDEVSEKEFNEQYLPIFVSSCDYYESLNAILFEYPRMFKKQIFYNRVIKVLECNQKLNYDKTVCRGNKKIIKRIEKQIKKYK